MQNLHNVHHSMSYAFNVLYIVCTCQLCDIYCVCVCMCDTFTFLLEDAALHIFQICLKRSTGEHYTPVIFPPIHEDIHLNVLSM